MRLLGLMPGIRRRERSSPWSVDVFINGLKSCSYFSFIKQASSDGEPQEGEEGKNTAQD
jgi:hypothetical protein